MTLAFACGKEDIKNELGNKNEGSVITRDDDPQEGCTCTMTVTEVINTDPLIQDGWGLTDFTASNMLPDFQGLNTTWTTSGGNQQSLPTNTRALPPPTPGYHNMKLTYLGGFVPEGFAIKARVDCSSPDPSTGASILRTSITYTFAWEDADSYDEGNDDLFSGANFIVPFGCEVYSTGHGLN